MRMANIVVALDAHKHLPFWLRRKHLVHNVLMAVHTCALRNSTVTGFDLYRFVKVLQREGQRMEEAIVSLDHPFTNRVMRQVTVITNRDVAMAGILP